MTDLWAIGRIDLRLSDADFGKLTPRLFDALLARKEAQDTRENIRAGVVAAAVVNFSMVHPDKPVSPMDFVPQGRHSKKAAAEEVDMRTWSAEEQTKYIKSLFKKKVFTHKGRR